MDIDYYRKYEPIFGEWYIEREIGAGSYGRVFEIRREDFGHTYRAALKAITIPQSQAEIDEARDTGMGGGSVTAYFRGMVDEFVNEFVIMERLKGHSNIVSYENHKVYEHEDGIGWDILIQMELLTPLNEYARVHGMTLRNVMELGIDLCKALELCQKNNIIHRDIKPENIFVSADGDYKLGDFGIARTAEKTMGGLSKKGTYTYMAPEVYRGERYGPSVDIYSLGIVLYRQLNNKRAPFLPPAPEPITHNDADRALSKRMSGTRLPPPANAEGRLAEIVLKACAFDPKDRYSSPMQMRQELEAILYRRSEGGTIYSGGDSVIERSDGGRDEQVYVDPNEAGYDPRSGGGTVSGFGADRGTVSGFGGGGSGADTGGRKKRRPELTIAAIILAVMLLAGAGVVLWLMSDTGQSDSTPTATSSPAATSTPAPTPTPTPEPTPTPTPAPTVAPTQSPVSVTQQIELIKLWFYDRPAVHGSGYYSRTAPDAVTNICVTTAATDYYAVGDIYEIIVHKSSNYSDFSPSSSFTIDHFYHDGVPYFTTLNYDDGSMVRIYYGNGGVIKWVDTDKTEHFDSCYIMDDSYDHAVAVYALAISLQ